MNILPTPLIKVCDVWKVFKRNGKNIVALQGISFDVYENEFVCIVGPSGCGKSTLLRIIDGLEVPTKGEVLFKNEPIKAPNPKIGIVFQSFALIPWKTVLENVEMGLLSLKMPKEKRIERALKYLHSVGLEGFEDLYPKELSGGMKQRVGIARALALEPEVLLLDEPFSSLDALTAETLRKETLEIWLREDIPTSVCIMVTHNVQEAVYMADRVIVLSARPGRVIKEIKITIPRPRNPRDATLFELEDRIISLIS
ncbi:MAG: ABC transporter ATP-binding protein [Candidatus Bathyarchaeia archaeon]